MSLSERIVDEGLLSRIKGLVSPQREMPKNFPIERKRRRGPPPSTPQMRPQPRHPAFQALAARKQRAQRPAVDPKAATQSRAHYATTEPHAHTPFKPSTSRAPASRHAPQAEPAATPAATARPASHSWLPAKRSTQATPTAAPDAQHASARETKPSPALGAKLAWLGAQPPAEPTPKPPAPAEPAGVLSTRHKPGTLAHTVHLFRQAKEIRSQIGRPVHVVQHAGKRFITTKPSAQHKILHTYEQLREVIRAFRATLAEATVALSVGPFMGSINGQRAVDVRSEGGKRRSKKTAPPLIRRSGPAGTGE